MRAGAMCSSEPPCTAGQCYVTATDATSIVPWLNGRGKACRVNMVKARCTCFLPCHTTTSGRRKVRPRQDECGDVLCLLGVASGWPRLLSWLVGGWSRGGRAVALLHTEAARHVHWLQPRSIRLNLHCNGCYTFASLLFVASLAGNRSDAAFSDPEGGQARCGPAGEASSACAGTLSGRLAVCTPGIRLGAG